MRNIQSAAGISLLTSFWPYVFLKYPHGKKYYQSLSLLCGSTDDSPTSQDQRSAVFFFFFYETYFVVISEAALVHQRAADGVTVSGSFLSGTLGMIVSVLIWVRGLRDA